MFVDAAKDVNVKLLVWPGLPNVTKRSGGKYPNVTGFDAKAIVTDYVRPSIFGPIIPKISVGLVYVLSVLSAAGLFIFNWTDVGITQAFKMLADL